MDRGTGKQTSEFWKEDGAIKALADRILPMSLKTSVEMFTVCLFPFLLSSFLEDIGRGRLRKEREDINGDGTGSRKWIWVPDHRRKHTGNLLNRMLKSISRSANPVFVPTSMLD